jgi:hypothetical protein
LQNIRLGVFGNIAADCEEFRQTLIQNGAIVPLVKQVTVVEIAWLLSFFTAREEECLKLMLEQGLTQLLLVYFANSTDELLVTPILCVFGNICCGSLDHHTDEWQMPYVHRILAKDSGFLPKLYSFLQMTNAEHVHLASESAWVLFDLAALDKFVVNVLVRHQFRPVLTQIAIQNGNFEIRRKGEFVLTNIALTSPELLAQVANDEILKVFFTTTTCS